MKTLRSISRRINNTSQNELLEQIRMLHLAIAHIGGREAGATALTLVSEMRDGRKFAFTRAVERSGLSVLQLALAFKMSASWATMPKKLQQDELQHVIGVWQRRCANNPKNKV